MTTASTCYVAGQLAEAIRLQTEVVRAAPTDAGKRLFLFELHAFKGDLERAARQLAAVKFDDPPTELAAQAYRLLVAAETQRRKVFRDGIAPQCFSPPPEHVQMRLEALQRLRENRQEEAKAILERANSSAPLVKGQLNGKAFQELRDADDVLGTVLEVMARGEYYWVPLEQIAGLGMNAPRYPRDILWFPARLTLREGQEGEVFLPALYPQSYTSQDEAIQLGRSTDWIESAHGPVLGMGLRTFVVDETAVALPEWRELVLD